MSPLHDGSLPCDSARLDGVLNMAPENPMPAVSQPFETVSGQSIENRNHCTELL